MPRESSLPPIFIQYSGMVSYIQQVNPTEWASTCPSCKGELHTDRTWPDRCRWFTEGNPVGWCRRCSKLFWPDKAPDYKPPTPIELERWRLERVKVEESRKQSAELALAHLRSNKIYEQYHRQLGEDGRKYWRNRGIPDSLQNYWKLGWIDEYLLSFKDETYLTPSATIPLFSAGWQPLNIKHRLLYPPEGAGKYRYELHGQPQPLFLSNPDLPLDGLVFVIEGEIKAMVTWLTLADRERKVVGIPGCSPSQDVISQLAQAERLVLVLDPGAEDAARKLAVALGIKRCKVLIPPMKIDDAILAIKPTKAALMGLLNTAISA